MYPWSLNNWVFKEQFIWKRAQTIILIKKNWNFLFWKLSVGDETQMIVEQISEVIKNPNAIEFDYV